MAVSSNEGDKGLGPGTDFTFGDMAYVLATVSRMHILYGSSIS